MGEENSGASQIQVNPYDLNLNSGQVRVIQI